MQNKPFPSYFEDDFLSLRTGEIYFITPYPNKIIKANDTFIYISYSRRLYTYILCIINVFPT